MKRSSLYQQIRDFCGARREVLLYLFFGGVSFVVSVGSFYIIREEIGLDVLVANVISWCLAVLVAFVTNRTWVFHAGQSGSGTLMRQMLSFFAGRVGTLLVEEAILLVLITWLHFSEMPVKLFAQAVVIAFNYFISKFVVFRRK